MAVVSLFWNSGAIALDVTREVTKSRSAQYSQATIFYSGGKVSDNYRPDLPSISFSGVVTYTKTTQSDTYKEPSDFSKLLDDMMDSQDLIYFTGTADNAIRDLNNCVITAYSLSRNVRYSDSLEVSLNLQQLDLSTGVQKTTISKPRDDAQGLTTDDPNKSSQGKTTENSPQIQSTSSESIANTISDKT